jgi:hypothetical protein
MLWFSNGGRAYAPWNGRHIGVLGIEDGCAAGADGHGAALTDNPIRREGVPTALALGGTHKVHHIIACLSAPATWTRVADVELAEGHLTLRDASGDQMSIPCQDPFQ